MNGGDLIKGYGATTNGMYLGILLSGNGRSFYPVSSWLVSGRNHPLPDSDYANLSNPRIIIERPSI